MLPLISVLLPEVTRFLLNLSERTLRSRAGMFFCTSPPLIIKIGNGVHAPEITVRLYIRIRTFTSTSNGVRAPEITVRLYIRIRRPTDFLVEICKSI